MSTNEFVNVSLITDPELKCDTVDILDAIAATVKGKRIRHMRCSIPKYAVKDVYEYGENNTVSTDIVTPVRLNGRVSKDCGILVENAMMHNMDRIVLLVVVSNNPTWCKDVHQRLTEYAVDPKYYAVDREHGVLTMPLPPIE